MIEKHACVVDADGHYETFVLILPVLDENGQEVEEIQNYQLKEGEATVDAMPPAWRPRAGAPGLVRPRWCNDTASWVEGAAAEEIAAWEAEHPAPPPGPTEAQALGQMVTDEQLERIAQGQEYTDLELAILGGTSHV